VSMSELTTSQTKGPYMKTASKAFAMAACVMVLVALTAIPQVLAKTYLYEATCENSYSKQGEMAQDLTKKKGEPISCDSVVLSMLDNGHVLLQFVEKSSHLTPLGFAGSKLDYEANPNFVTMPLEKVYLPHSSKPDKPEFIEGFEGYCFLDGKLNITKLGGISCAAKIEIGTQKLIYRINARIKSVGEPVPGF